MTLRFPYWLRLLVCLALLVATAPVTGAVANAALSVPNVENTAVLAGSQADCHHGERHASGKCSQVYGILGAAGLRTTLARDALPLSIAQFRAGVIATRDPYPPKFLSI